MSNAIYNVPKPVNEPVLDYAPGSKERKEVKEMLKRLKSETWDIPMVIGGKYIKTGKTETIRPPHELDHILGQYHIGDASHVKDAINAAMKAKNDWELMPWEDRAAIFLKAADLIAGPYRAKMNAATMLGQSKNVFQAEIDCVCELADFFRFNVYFMTKIYKEQPYSPYASWNRMEYRPLEGFVFALTPFNFTSIAGNLPGAPAILGNTVVWKPARTQIYSAWLIMEILKEAGLPDGVINMINVSGSIAGDVIFTDKDFAGLHFTGSNDTFRTIWRKISENLEDYRSFPRIVGETGGKDFIIAHPSAIPSQVTAALLRGAFEYQGQKCSAASRAYIPKSMWNDVFIHLKEGIEDIRMGSPEDFRNFLNAVIDEGAFRSITGYIDQAKTDNDADVIIGGDYDKTKGYFIQPTVIKTENPQYRTMVEEIFGPVLTVYVYDDEKYIETLRLVDNSSVYGLTGAIFSIDRRAIEIALEELRNSAGNFYINDKPTGAVVGQQPFGGARGSGTNDKAGSLLNLYRWVSPRTIKEKFVTADDFKYPFMEEK
ncbi:MAG: L-glutamate gamma-semialdehyde dehydrogenase [Deltaproteobacteria bacterium]